MANYPNVKRSELEDMRIAFGREVRIAQSWQRLAAALAARAAEKKAAEKKER